MQHGMNAYTSPVNYSRVQTGIVSCLVYVNICVTNLYFFVIRNMMNTQCHIFNVFKVDTASQNVHQARCVILHRLWAQGHKFDKWTLLFDQETEEVANIESKYDELQCKPQSNSGKC